MPRMTSASFDRSEGSREPRGANRVEPMSLAPRPEHPLRHSRLLQSSLISIVMLLGACTGSDVRARPEGAPAPEGSGTPRSDIVVAKRDTVVVPDSIRR